MVGQAHADVISQRSSRVWVYAMWRDAHCCTSRAPVVHSLSMGLVANMSCQLSHGPVQDGFRIGQCRPGFRLHGQASLSDLLLIEGSSRSRAALEERESPFNNSKASSGGVGLWAVVGCWFLLVGLSLPFSPPSDCFSLPSMMTWAPCPHGVRTREKKGELWWSQVLLFITSAVLNSLAETSRGLSDRSFEVPDLHEAAVASSPSSRHESGQQEDHNPQQRPPPFGGVCLVQDL